MNYSLRSHYFIRLPVIASRGRAGQRALQRGAAAGAARSADQRSATRSATASRDGAGTPAKRASATCHDPARPEGKPRSAGPGGAWKVRSSSVTFNGLFVAKNAESDLQKFGQPTVLPQPPTRHPSTHWVRCTSPGSSPEHKEGVRERCST